MELPELILENKKIRNHLLEQLISSDDLLERLVLKFKEEFGPEKDLVYFYFKDLKLANLKKWGLHKILERIEESTFLLEDPLTKEEIEVELKCSDNVYYLC